MKKSKNIGECSK